MHGPTCIFWTNLTPFSLKPPAGVTPLADPSVRVTAATLRDMRVPGPLPTEDMTPLFVSKATSNMSEFTSFCAYGAGLRALSSICVSSLFPRVLDSNNLMYQCQ